MRIFSPSKDYTSWHPPVFEELSYKGKDSLIRYGKDLFARTGYYYGPKGRLNKISNGMDCQNCHEFAGTKNFSNCLSAVASTYPKFRERSGKIESVSFRVNECFERSLNGQKLDTTSLEMQAMIAYMVWLGKGIPINIKPVGAGTAELPFLERAADPGRGKITYLEKCVKCHGVNGAGVWKADSSGFIYPPLWGENSFNTSAGLFRLTKLAAFIKDNMPFGANHEQPQLTNETAWDLAAFISSQPRPQIFFKNDWPVVSKKPVDYPFPPFADNFPEEQHKYGPFAPIAASKKPQ